MAPKRKHHESEPQETVHASRQFQIYGNNPKPAKKPRKTETPIYKKQAHASSVNAIKKRIRDVTRKLERSQDLPANVRIEDERALTAYQQELAAAGAEKVRQKMIKKYHMVRFFERQKATRLLKKLRKCLLESTSTHEVEALKEQMHVAEVDLNYTQYCPLSEVYISLYPQKTKIDGEEAEKEEAAPKPPMWVEIEKCMEEGTLDWLRNRVSTVRVVAVPKALEKRPAKAKPKAQAAMVDTTGMNRRERRSQKVNKEFGLVKTKNKSMAFERNQVFGASQAVQKNRADDEGNDSDGGFFEE